MVLRRDVPAESRFGIEGLEERCDVVLGDLVDYESLVRALNEYEVKAVFHLGAQTIVGTANRSPLSTFETNIRGTYLLLEACRAVGVVGDAIERVVVASSDKAYGSHDELPYTRGLRAPAALPVRRLEGGHRHDRPLLRGHLRAAGGGHAAGERLRRRRLQLQPRSCPTRRARSCAATAR